LPPEEKWRRVKPCWGAVRYGGYARIARLTTRLLTGADDLDDDSVAAVTDAMRRDNTPGLYRRWFRERCRFERLIVSNGTRPVETYAYTADDLALMSLIIGIVSPRSAAELQVYEKGTGLELRTPAALKKGLEIYIAAQAVDRGVVGFKAMSQYLADAPAEAAVERALVALVQGRTLEAGAQADLNRFFYDEAFKLVRETRLPVGVHCGVWGDFRASDVTNFIGVIQRFPEIAFDLFHMSIPSARENALVVKNFRNAYGNLCWSPTLSPAIFESALAEWLDMVPVNKVTAFGGDVIFGPQAVYGSRAVCLDSLARVFADRVEAGRMTITEAQAVLKAWLYDNPRRLYKLPG
jgi:predicted TIM-barrel fold metal-dependent hydrolase